MTFQNDSVSLADMDLITPGAVFKRKKNETLRKVLFLTNVNVSPKQAKLFPSMVVFLDEGNEIRSMDCVNFLKYSTFYNVDPELEQMVNSLLIFHEADDDVPTLDEAVRTAIEAAGGNPDTAGSLLDIAAEDFLVDEPAETTSIIQAEVMPAGAIVAASEPGQPTMEGPISFVAGSEPASVAAEVLAIMVDSYEQQPDLELNLLMHKITFSVPANISTEQIRSCFSPTSEASYPAFELNPQFFGAEAGRVNWTHLVGGYLVYRAGRPFYQMILGEDCSPVSAAEETAGDQPASVQAEAAAA